MPSQFYRNLQDADVYLEDKTLIGLAKEVDLGVIEYNRSEKTPMGGVGGFNISGKLKAMEGSINFESLISEVWGDIHPMKHLALQLHSQIDNWENGGMVMQQALITHLVVGFYKVPLGKFSQSESTGFETGFSIMAVKQVVDGVEMREIDFINNIDNFMGTPVKNPVSS